MFHHAYEPRSEAGYQVDGLLRLIKYSIPWTLWLWANFFKVDLLGPSCREKGQSILAQAFEFSSTILRTSSLSGHIVNPAGRVTDNSASFSVSASPTNPIWAGIHSRSILLSLFNKTDRLHESPRQERRKLHRVSLRIWHCVAEQNTPCLLCYYSEWEQSTKM